MTTKLKATLILDSKMVLQDGRVLQRKIWQLPKAQAEGSHYSAYSAIDGACQT